MRLLLIIGSGSFIGGILRYLSSRYIQMNVLLAFPFGTLIVNLAGCFLIGLVYGISDRGQMSPETRLFLATGVLGGFTTFSAFSNETVGMIRDGQLGYAGLYILASVFLGILFTMTGILLTKIF